LTLNNDILYKNFNPPGKNDQNIISLTEHLLQSSCVVDVPGERYARVSDTPSGSWGKSLVTQGPPEATAFHDYSSRLKCLEFRF